MHGLRENESFDSIKKQEIYTNSSNLELILLPVTPKILPLLIINVIIIHQLKIGGN